MKNYNIKENEEYDTGFIPSKNNYKKLKTEKFYKLKIFQVKKLN